MGLVRRLGLVLLVAVTASLAVLPTVQGASNLLVFEDDYLNLNYTDTALTTATVLTAPPGVVTLSYGQLGFAYRPNQRQVAVALADRIALLAYTGSGLKEIKSFYVSGITSLAFSEKGEFLFAGGNNEIKIFGFTSEGDLKQIGRVPFYGVVSVEGAAGSSFWALSGSKASYFGFVGSSTWRELFAFSVGSGKAINYNARRNAVLVVDGDRVRYLAFNGSTWIELSLFSVTVPGAQAAVWAADGSGYRVLAQGQSIIYFALTPYGIRRYSPLDDSYTGVLGLVRSPWGVNDYGLSVSGTGLYRAWTGSGYVTRPELSFTIGGQGSGLSAVYVSKIITTATPVFMVRLVPTEVVPAQAATFYQVSTDGGGTWTDVTPLAITTVPPGNQLVYRIILSTTDLSHPPVIDKVQLLQIAYVVQPASKVLGSGQFKVRLVK